ncbi:unnamed protein product [Rotaria sordida]|uniref:Uncharacterized protein n=1 Tax=Rotaria sordida TaxID=392033 RepID=A0A818XG92_9BILA|nr:unnamed protein product [Rotaria sordida]
MNTVADELTRTIVITTTQIEIIRQIEVAVPSNEAVSRLHSHLDQSLTDHVRFSPRTWTNVHGISTPTNIKRSQKTLWWIGCLFIIVGILALSIVIISLTIAFRKINIVREIDIERYDLGDLYYGMNNINQINFSSNTYLSSDNKILIQKYFSNQLLNEPGYRALFIERIFIQDQSIKNKQKQRLCSIILIIQNIQIYFDQCSNCINERNFILRRLFFNITAFQQSFYLLLNNLHISIQICSTLNIYRFIVPIRLNISYGQKINSSLSIDNSNLKYISSTMKNILLPLKLNSSIATTKYININSIISTIPFKKLIDSTSTIHLIETTNFIDYVEESMSSTMNDLSTITDINTFQTQETSSVFFNEIQTSNYIEETTQSPSYILTSIKLTTNHRQQSSIKSGFTTKTSFQKTTPSMFQFLPFRPSTTISPWQTTLSSRFITRNYNNSSTMIQTNRNRIIPFTQRRT